MRILARPPFLLRQLYPGAAWRMNASEKKIFLTFDDGPVPGVTPAALSVLKEQDVRATFFCVGENVQRHPEIFSSILEQGHRVGNHTFHHADGWKHTSRSYLREVRQCAEVVKSDLFRPPYGRMRRSQFEAIRRKYKVIMWDVLTCDFDLSLSCEDVLSIAAGHSRPGSVIVFHDSLKAKERMLYVLPKYIAEMKTRGFAFDVL
ncbi:MAG TPA: polysaccharide deacetylase family protein [Bacteroidia bacterium]|nr:polysaccharide deacetylase family protein [Bacteroidia bacterium]